MSFVQIKSLAAWLWAWCLALAVAAGADPEEGSAAKQVQLLGRMDVSRITESSGVVASRQFPEVFWTHNDGGKRRPELFAITRRGKMLAHFTLLGSRLRDWEDIAIDNQRHLYFGDIGNNEAHRSQLAVYQVDEPDPKSSGPALSVKRQWTLCFPKAPFDCESLFVHQGHGYVISKVFKDKRAEIYRFPLAGEREEVLLEFVVRLKIESPVTGADLSPDGRFLAVVSKAGAFVWPVQGAFEGLAKVKPLSAKFSHEHIEGCCFVPEGLLATAESGEVYLFPLEAFRPGLVWTKPR